MKFIRSILLAAAVTGMASAAVAGKPIKLIDSLCAQGPGHWSGSFLLKDEAVCQQYGGCMHYVQADITYLGGDQYQLDLHPATGTGGTAPVTCNSGVVTTAALPGGEAKIRCSKDKSCVVRYEDARLISEMRKVS